MPSKENALEASQMELSSGEGAMPRLQRDEGLCAAGGGEWRAPSCLPVWERPKVSEAERPESSVCPSWSPRPLCRRRERCRARLGGGAGRGGLEGALRLPHIPLLGAFDSRQQQQTGAVRRGECGGLSPYCSALGAGPAAGRTSQSSLLALPEMVLSAVLKSRGHSGRITES